MQVGIIGSGHIGATVGRLWAQAGHTILFSSRHPEQLSELVKIAGPSARAGSIREAADFGEMILLSVPWRGVEEALAAAGSLDGKIVIDTTNQFSAGSVQHFPEGISALEFNARRAKGARLVKAYNTLTAGFLAESAGRRGQQRVAMPYAGEDAQAKQVVASLIAESGFDPFDVGGWSEARLIEPPRRPGAFYGEEWHLDTARTLLHQLEGIGSVEQEMLESWSTLAFAAARTNRIKLGTLVTGVTYRHPSILVKTATTLDVLSHGRAYLGIGAAWNEEEHRGLGVPFPPVKERFERLEETLQIALQMWSGDERPYEGKHYQLARPLNSPQAIQKPHPSILIGGGGERKTLRLVARYGDACNLFTSGDHAELRHKLDVLREHCQSEGRPYEQIEKTAYSHVLLQLTRDGRDQSCTPGAFIEQCAHLAELGIDQVTLSLKDVHEAEPFELFEHEIIPAVEKIPVAGR